MAGFRSALFILGISSPVFVPPVVTSTDGQVLVKDTAIAKGAEWRQSLPSLIALAPGPTTFNIQVADEEFPDGTAPYYRAKAILTGAKWARLTGTISSSGVSALIACQYSVNNGSTWDYLDGVSGPVIPTLAGVTQASPWVELAAGAKADVLLRLLTADGDTSAITAYNLYVEFSYVGA